MASGPISVRAAGSSSFTKDVYSVSPASVPLNGEFTISFGGSDLKSDSYIELVGANGVREFNKIHTSCSQPLKVGDVFGSLELVGFNGQTAGNEVIYTYNLSNKGDALTGVRVNDDKLGFIKDTSGNSTFNLSGGALLELKASTEINQTTTNTAIATGNLGTGGQCSSNEATATVTVETSTGPFVCKDAKPINEISMIWNGLQNVKIKAWKGSVGSTLLATIDNIKPGDKVTVTGYAGSPNDVIWEIFNAGTTVKIGSSTFHLSCSDADMNGSEDCGKQEGDGKGLSGYINNWLLAGMAGNDQRLVCR